MQGQSVLKQRVVNQNLNTLACVAVILATLEHVSP